ncbi:response regulator [Proteiniborus sp.]|uniref:response regulator n=1 Tax=Proteiniborus sp. TaxID=2079015 RepID=UPI003333A4B7
MYKVFIVEDDPMVLSINKRFVEKLPDFKVIETSKKGKEAVAKIVEMEPDLILLDVFMPEQSGLDLLREIRNSQTNSEVIMITAAQDAETVTEALRLGVIDYIIKPYNFARFKQALEVFISKMNTIKDITSFTQSEIDQMKNLMQVTGDELSSSKDEELPKGLDKITLNKIKDAIDESDKPMSSSNMAKLLGLSRITTRKYLEYLVDTGVLELLLEYGGVGRPTRLYYNPNKK